jgi:hypothetical protein
MDQNTEYKVLESSLDNTLIMLSYAAQRGIDVNRSDIATIMSAISGIRSGNLPSEQQTQFWISAVSIARAISPVTLDSLQSCIPSNGKSTSLAHRDARRYRARTIVTLIALLIFQIYWLIGATLISDINNIQTNLSKLRDQDITLKRSLSDLDNTKADDQIQIAKIRAQLDANQSDRLAAKADAEVNYTVLRNWNFGKVLLLGSSSYESTSITDTSSGFSEKIVVETQTAKIVLTALIKYILPILYGLLGAIAYIVRSFTEEFKEYIYTSNINVRNYVRFYLGAVAGFSIAWFTSGDSSPENTGILQSLSPLALAFLAGYSVDLLFSLLDRIVFAFAAPAPTVSSRPLPPIITPSPIPAQT